jgi:hypothetical protein
MSKPFSSTPKEVGDGWLFDARHNRYGFPLEKDFAVIVYNEEDHTSGWNRHWKVTIKQTGENGRLLVYYGVEQDIAEFTNLKVAKAFSEMLASTLSFKDYKDHNVRFHLRKSFKEEIEAYQEMDVERARRIINKKAAWKLPEEVRPKTDGEWKAFEAAMSMHAMAAKLVMEGASPDKADEMVKKLALISALSKLQDQIKQAVGDNEDEEDDD